MTIAFTIENAVRLAVAQVAVIVMSAAGALVSRKIAGPGAVPWLTVFFAEFAIPSLAVPLVWIASVLLIRRDPRISDAAKGLAFASGIALIVMFVVLGGIAFVRPLLSLHGFESGLEAGVAE